MTDAYRRVDLMAGSWRLDGVPIAESFVHRARGIRARGVSRLLLRTGSIHTLGLSEPIRVVGIDDAGVVVSSELVRPNRVHRVRDAKWMLELRACDRPPVRGSTIAFVPSSGAWQEP